MNSNPLVSTSRRLPLLALLAVGCALVAAPAASAAPCNDSFTGALGSGWDDSANWSTGAVPGASQNVCLASGVAQVEIGPGVHPTVATITGFAPLRIDAGGSLTLMSNSTAVTSALADLDLQGELATEGSAIELDGANTVDGAIQGPAATVTLTSGSLGGTGTIGPRFINAGGKVEPGGAGVVGTLNFGADYRQSEAGELDLDLASDSSFDRIQPAALSDALISGRLVVHTLGAYKPAVDTTWDFITGTAGVSREWTLTPSEFSAYSIPGGAELRLVSELPSEGGDEGPGGGGPGGGNGETPGGGGPGGGQTPGGSGGETPGGSGSSGPGSSLPGGSTDPGTTAPGGSTDPGGSPGTGPSGTTPVPGSAAEEALLRGCTPGPLWLTDVYLKGSRVYVSGAAPQVTAGETVNIVRFHRTVATTKVGADGTFHVLAKAPPARFRRSSWYAAVINGLRSPAIPLSQRLVLEAPRRVGRKVVISGAAPIPRHAWPRPVTITAQAKCGVQVKVRSFKPKRDGRFRITIPAPRAAGVTVYQLTSGSDLSFAVPLLPTGH
jgi:hypothetical protein